MAWARIVCDSSAPNSLPSNRAVIDPRFAGARGLCTASSEEHVTEDPVAQ
uniref:Uncharacterized protein n=1 Tax=Zea mays TaxID=4577 RepID=B6TGR0_MAIZE|nr:hypothetical protein [Zea mays]